MPFVTELNIFAFVFSDSFRSKLLIKEKSLKVHNDKDIHKKAHRYLTLLEKINKYIDLYTERIGPVFAMG